MHDFKLFTIQTAFLVSVLNRRSWYFSINITLRVNIKMWEIICSTLYILFYFCGLKMWTGKILYFYALVMGPQRQYFKLVWMKSAVHNFYGASNIFEKLDCRVSFFQIFNPPKIGHERFCLIYTKISWMSRKGGGGWILGLLAAEPESEFHPNLFGN